MCRITGGRGGGSGGGGVAVGATVEVGKTVVMRVGVGDGVAEAHAARISPHAINAQMQIMDRLTFAS
ncbi:MAG: hypothetical protein ACC647_01315 [Anaerolineales bacterium]